MAALALVLGAMACVEQATLPTGTTTPTRGGSTTAGPGDSTASVTVADNSFSPSSVTINVGGTVTWTWTGANQHNVTFTDTTLAASPTQSTGTYSLTFSTTGTFPYHCTIHGETGTVVVQ